MSSNYCSTDLPFLIRHFVAKWTSVTLPRFCLQSRPYHWPFNAMVDSLFQGSHVPVCNIRFCFNQKLAVFFLDFQFGMTPYMALPVCDDVMFLSQWSIDRQVQLSPYSASSIFFSVGTSFSFTETLIYTLKKGHFEPLSAKTVILSFLENKRLLQENSLHQINRIIYLKATYGTKKMKRNRFFNSCHSILKLSWPSLLNCLAQ